MPYILLTTAALILLAVGVFVGWNQWVTVVIVAVPLVVMAAFAMFSGRSRIADEGGFHIESRGPLSDGQMLVDVPMVSLPPVIQQDGFGSATPLTGAQKSARLGRRMLGARTFL